MAGDLTGGGAFARAVSSSALTLLDLLPQDPTTSGGHIAEVPSIFAGFKSGVQDGFQHRGFPFMPTLTPG